METILTTTRSRRCALLALVLPALAGCGRNVLTTDDVVRMDNQRAVFAASVYRDYGSSFHDDIEGVEVRFTANGRLLARAVTNAEGRAVAYGRVSPDIHTFEARTRVKDETLRASGAVYHWSRGKTIVAVDVDETISATRYSDLFIAEIDGSRPIPGAREGVWALSKDYHILDISARPEFLQEKTRQWLQFNGFPPGPYAGADRFAACLDQAGFKKRMLASMKSRWPNLLIGVGDKGVDDKAYGANGMLTLIVKSTPPGSFSQRCVVVQNWGGLQAFFNTHRERLSNPVQLASLLRTNGDQLRPVFDSAPVPSEAREVVRSEPLRPRTQAVVQRPTGNTNPRF